MQRNTQCNVTRERATETERGGSAASATVTPIQNPLLRNECNRDFSPTVRQRVLSVTKRRPAERSLDGAKPHAIKDRARLEGVWCIGKLLEVTGAEESENVHRESGGQNS